ncbi:MAG: ParM/StbA family protein [Chloroflexi bacterium]|nr:ParM/StbA family protein [Chloroflexota bacterium]
MPTLLGVDPGNGAIKLYGAAGGVQLPAVIASDGARIVRAAGLSTTKPPLSVRTAAGAFYLGPGAHDWGRPIENMDHDRFTGTPEMRALVYGALATYAVPNDLPAELHLTVGLPVETLSGSEAPAAAAAVRRWLEGAHAWDADGKAYQTTVAGVTVSLQPAGALYDYLLDDDGAFRPERKAKFGEEIGVVSVGMNTVEILVVRGGKVIPGDTHGTRLGVRRLLELGNPDGLYTLGELDAQLRTGKLDVAQTLPIWASEVTGFLERRWGVKFRRFAAVILVGGGALLLRDLLLARFGGKAYVPDDPVLATARGLYKLAGLTAARRRG